MTLVRLLKNGKAHRLKKSILLRVRAKTYHARSSPVLPQGPQVEQQPQQMHTAEISQVVWPAFSTAAKNIAALLKFLLV